MTKVGRILRMRRKLRTWEGLKSAVGIVRTSRPRGRLPATIDRPQCILLAFSRGHTCEVVGRYEIVNAPLCVRRPRWAEISVTGPGEFSERKCRKGTRTAAVLAPPHATPGFPVPSCHRLRRTSHDRKAVTGGIPTLEAMQVPPSPESLG